MALSKDVYSELENIVGPDNISDDPTLLDSYIYPLNTTSNHLGPYYETFTPRGDAVLLPGSTEEVQAIVKVCNKYGKKFKASSTFWAAMGYPTDEHAIQLDMRRMDRILEIDEKNMFAVIEPGVIGATLQAEAMKVGLNTHIIGAGATCSPLASATSYGGAGPDTIFMGYSPENMLGLEWVMPDGNILRTGSLDSGQGWFCGEGPGPGLRSIVRGAQGAMGAMGVFTKCAIKLYPWPGPARVPVMGIIPAYKTRLPDNFKAYSVAFPTWTAWADACHMIWDAGIGYICHRQFSMFGRDLKAGIIRIISDHTKTLSDLKDVLNDPEVIKHTEEAKREFEIVLVGMTRNDIEWQEKVLSKILADTGGWKVAAMAEPAMQEYLLLYLIRMGHKNLNCTYVGGYEGCFGLMGPPDFGTTHVEAMTEFKRGMEKKGLMVDAGGDCAMGGLGGMGGGGTCGWENFTYFDPYDKESVKDTCDFFDTALKFGLENKMGSGMQRLNAYSRGPDGKTPPNEEQERILLASQQPSAFRYQRKIKEAIDPNNLGDSYYRTLTEPK